MTHIHHRIITEAVPGQLIGRCKKRGCDEKIRSYSIDPEKLYGGRSRAELVAATKKAGRECSGCGERGHDRRACRL